MYHCTESDRDVNSMILEVSASSWLVRGAAALVLVVHIGAAGIALLAGAAALWFRKGQRLHRIAGNVFFVSMLIMCAIGAVVAPFLPQPQWTSTLVAVLTSYLVATSWVTIRRQEGTIGRFEIGALFVPLTVAVTLVTLGVQAATRPTTSPAGAPLPAYFVFAAIAALAAALDLRVILRRGVSGTQRLTRHLWRMCVALLIASFSFFLGQPQVFPAYIRRSPILYVPEIAVLVLMVFWLARVRRTSVPTRDAAGRRALARGYFRSPSNARDTRLMP